MEKRELTPEEKLRKITRELIEANSDHVSVKKLAEIIGFQLPMQKKPINPYQAADRCQELQSAGEYRESYIS
jgi:hypothetical protein